MLIVGATLVISLDKYKAATHCWLNVETDMIWAFVGPVLFILGVRTLGGSEVGMFQGLDLIHEGYVPWINGLVFHKSNFTFKSEVWWQVANLTFGIENQHSSDPMLAS